MKLTVKDTQGKDQGELEVKFELVEGGRGTQAVHDAVVAYNAAQRMGTASTKTMGEVAGSGKKPWRHVNRQQRGIWVREIAGFKPMQLRVLRHSRAINSGQWLLGAVACASEGRD